MRSLFFCFLLLAKNVLAQNTEPVRYIGIEHGLSNNAVTSIYQDHNGFMWFGTYDGLNRYDGYTFRVFRNIIGDSTSLGDNHVSTIEGDANHNLWIGCEKGVYIYNPLNSKFSRPVFKPWNGNSLQPIRDNVPVICSIDNGKSILVGTANKGLLLFEGNDEKGIQIPVSGTKNQGNYTVTSIAEDPFRKTTWVMVMGTGLCRYDRKARELQIVNTSVKESDCLKLDSKGNLWVGNGDGLFAYDNSNDRFSKNILPSKYRVIKIFEDRQHTLWIASDGGGVWYVPLNTLQAKPYLSFQGTSLINSNSVYSIYEDNEGRKWVGTLRGGINLIQPYTSSFRSVVYNPPGQNNPINNFILSFCEDEKNNVWIGTDGATWQKSTGEFYKMPITASTAEYAFHIPQNSELINQTSMFADDDHHPYIATYWREEGTTIPQYHLVYKTNDGWKKAILRFRSTSFSISGAGTKRIPISRPQILAWKTRNNLSAALIFRDEERGSKVSAAISKNIGEGKWTVIDLSSNSVGSWEPTYDTELWKKKKWLHLFVQNVEQVDAEGQAKIPPQIVQVLEWYPQKATR